MYKALTPTDSAEQVEEYLEALTWALQQKDIHNIALAGDMAPEKVVSLKPFCEENARRNELLSIGSVVETRGYLLYQ